MIGFVNMMHSARKRWKYDSALMLHKEFSLLRLDKTNCTKIS